MGTGGGCVMLASVACPASHHTAAQEAICLLDECMLGATDAKQHRCLAGEKGSLSKMLTSQSIIRMRQFQRQSTAQIKLSSYILYLARKCLSKRTWKLGDEKIAGPQETQRKGQGIIANNKGNQ